MHAEVVGRSERGVPVNVGAGNRQLAALRRVQAAWSTVGQRSSRPHNCANALTSRGDLRLATNAGWRSSGTQMERPFLSKYQESGSRGRSAKKLVDGRGGRVASCGGHCVVHDDVTVLIPECQLIGGKAFHIGPAVPQRSHRNAGQRMAQPPELGLVHRSAVGFDDPVFKASKVGRVCGLRKRAASRMLMPRPESRVASRSRSPWSGSGPMRRPRCAVANSGEGGGWRGGIGGRRAFVCGSWFVGRGSWVVGRGSCRVRLELGTSMDCSGFVAGAVVFLLVAFYQLQRFFYAIGGNQDAAHLA